MGRRSKLDLCGVVEIAVNLYTQEKLSFQQIADRLREEYDVDSSREGVRRAVKNAQENAQMYQRAVDEAKIMIDSIRDNPNTDLAEATLNKFASLIFTELKGIEELNFSDPGDIARAIGQIANAQAKIGSLRMKYQNGFEAAQKAVLAALKRELKAEHPDLLDRLTSIVGGLEAPAA
jgi:hypothetical protein